MKVHLSAGQNGPYTYKDNLLVKVVKSSAVGPSSITGNSKLRQKSGVGQEMANFCGIDEFVFKT